MMIKSSAAKLLALLSQLWLLVSCILTPSSGQQVVQQTIDETQSQWMGDYVNGLMRKTYNEFKDVKFDEIYRDFYSLLLAYEQRLENQRRTLSEFHSRRQFAVKSGSKIYRKQIVKSLVATNIVNYENFVGTPQVYQLPDTSIYESPVVNLRKAVSSLKSKSSLVVPVNSNGSYIKGELYFDFPRAVSISSQSVEIRDFSPSVLRDLVYHETNTPQLIDSPIYLTKSTSTKRLFAGQINGLNLHHGLALKSLGKVSIRGPIRIGQLKSDHISTKILRDLNYDNLIFINSKQRSVSISAPLHFDTIVSVNELSASNISNVHLRAFVSSALTYNSEQIISKPISVKATRFPEIKLIGNLNGVNFNKRIVKLIRADLPIHAPKLTILGRSLRARNLEFRSLNNLYFPNDFLTSKAEGLQTISIPVNFNHLVVRQANLNGLVNGLRYPNSFVTLDGNETIYSDLHFANSITVKQNVYTNGLFGRRKVIDLATWAYDKDPLSRHLRNNPSGSIVINGDLFVKQEINGLQFDRLIPDLVHLSDPRTIQVTGIKTFLNSMTIPSINLKQINSKPLIGFALSSNLQISSPIRFIQPLSIKNLHLNGVVRMGSIFDLIQKRVSLVYDGTINGDIFINDMFVNRLDIDPLKSYKINKLSPSELVFANQQQTIQGIKTFTSSTTITKPILATSIRVGKYLNDRNVDVILSRKRQVIKLNHLILRNSFVSDLNLNSSSHLARSLVSLSRNMLLKDGDQVITKHKKFLNHVFFDSEIGSRSSRGVQKGPLINFPKIYIDRKLYLDSLTILGNLQVKGRLNNLDISRPLQDLLKPDNYYYTMMASQSFYNGLIAKNLRFKYLNGKPFANYWQKRISPEFLGPVKTNQLIVHGKVNLNGLLNEVSIVDSIKQIKRDQAQRKTIIYGDVTFYKPVSIARNLNISGKINNVPFDWLTRDLPESDQIIIGPKTARGLKVGKNLHVKYFNGIPLNSLLNRIVLVHPRGALYLADPVEFASEVIIKHDLFQDRVRSRFNRKINGILVRRLLDRQIDKRSLLVMRKDTFEFLDPVEIKSEQPLIIKGKVNGLDLVRDVIWLRNYFPNQVITGFKSFTRAHFGSNVNILNSFNNINLSNNLRRIIDLRRTQNITDHVKIEGKVILSSNLAVSMINDMHSSDLVNIVDDKYIRVKGKWIFTGPVVMRQDLLVNGKIKNVSLTDLSRYSLRNDIPQKIDVPIKLDQIVLKHVDPYDPLVRDLQQIEHSYISFWNKSIAQRIANLEHDIELNQITRNHLNRYLQSVPMEIKGFRVVQELPQVTGHTIAYHSPDSISIGLMAGENVIFKYLSFNGSQWINGAELTTPFINNYEFKLDKKVYNLFQASPKSSSASILTQEKEIIGYLGRSYSDLQILSLNNKANIISALSSVRGVVETFTFGIVNDSPDFRIISTLNVSSNARKISLFRILNEIYLAVARSSDKGCEYEDNTSLLFHWLEKKYFKLIQKFNHFEATNVVHYTYNDHNYLVFSEGKGKPHRLTDRAIHVYRDATYKWPDCQFDHFNSLDFERATDLQTFTVPSSPWPVQLLAALNSSTLTIWQQKGSSGFEKIWSKKLAEGQAFKFFILNERLHLIITQLSQISGSSIFESTLSGL